MNLFAGYKGEPPCLKWKPLQEWAGYIIMWMVMEIRTLGLPVWDWISTSTWAKAKHGHWVPAIVYDMQGTYPETKSRFNANNAGFELTAGLTYHFKTSNGTHHFAKVRVYNQAEIDGLNSSINALRSEVKTKTVRSATPTSASTDCKKNLKPVVQKLFR